MKWIIFFLQKLKHQKCLLKVSIIHGIWYFPQVFSSSCSKHWKHESNGLIHLCLHFSCQIPSSVLLGHGEGEGGGAEDPGEFQIPTLIRTNLVQTIGTFSGLQTLHLNIHYCRLSVVFIWIEGLIVMQNKIFWHFVMFLILFRHYIYMCTRLTILHLAIYSKVSKVGMVELWLKSTFGPTFFSPFPWPNSGQTLPRDFR